MLLPQDFDPCNDAAAYRLVTKVDRTTSNCRPPRGDRRIVFAVSMRLRITKRGCAHPGYRQRRSAHVSEFGRRPTLLRGDKPGDSGKRPEVRVAYLFFHRAHGKLTLDERDHLYDTH